MWVSKMPKKFKRTYTRERHDSMGHDDDGEIVANVL